MTTCAWATRSAPISPGPPKAKGELEAPATQLRIVGLLPAHLAQTVRDVVPVRRGPTDRVHLELDHRRRAPIGARSAREAKAFYLGVERILRCVDRVAASTLNGRRCLRRRGSRLRPRKEALQEPRIKSL